MKTDGLTLAAGAGFEIQMLDDARRGASFPIGTQGALWELTEAVGLNQPGIYEFQDSWVLRNPAYSALTYDLSGTILGRPDPGAKVLYVVASRTFFIQGAMAGAIARALQAPGSVQDFTVNVLRGNQQISVGVIRFNDGMEMAEFLPSSPNPVQVLRGDAVIILAPDVVDQNIADISMTLCGYLSV